MRLPSSWRFAGLAVGRCADLLSAARGAHDAGESRVAIRGAGSAARVTSTRSQPHRSSRSGRWPGAARRLYEGGLVVNSVGGVGVRVLSWVDLCERRSSLYRLLGGRTRRHWRPASGAQFQKGRQAARRTVAPPEAGVGAKGWLLVSMCQIASVSFRAMSIWATLAPRWRPRRFLLRW